MFCGSNNAQKRSTRSLNGVTCQRLRSGKELVSFALQRFSPRIPTHMLQAQFVAGKYSSQSASRALENTVQGSKTFSTAGDHHKRRPADLRNPCLEFRGHRSSVDASNFLQFMNSSANIKEYSTAAMGAWRCRKRHVTKPAHVNMGGGRILIIVIMNIEQTTRQAQFLSDESSPPRYSGSF